LGGPSYEEVTNGSEEKGKEGQEEQGQEKGSRKEKGQEEEVALPYVFLRLEREE